MAAPITTSANDPYERLISQTIQIERQPRFELTDKRNEEERFSAVLDDFDSELSALHGQLQTLTDAVTNPFEGRSVQAGETEAFDVTASDDASFGSHTLKVERLASADGRLSKQYDAAGGALRTFFDANGSQTFSIGVATPTEDAPDARTDVAVTIDPAGATNEEILDEIGAAIDAAMEEAVSAGTIKRSERAGASTIQETTDTARLSLRSGTTGYAGRLTFTDSADGLLSQLEASAGTVASGTGGGQVTAVGTGEADSGLNSRFMLDGLTLYRSTNRVTDALDGLTIDLQQTGEAAAGFEVSPDGEGIKKQITSFVKKYNSVLGFIERKAAVDGETGQRGDFAGERAFSSLRYQMRNDVARAVPGGAVRRLSDLGLTIERDGTLKLDDEEALLAAVEKDATAVQQFFAGDDGVATRLTERMERFTDTGGLIDRRQDSAEVKMERLDDQITAFDDRLARREEQLRAEYALLQETIAALQGQQQSISFFSYGF